MITKHSKLFKTIIDIPGTTRNSAEFAESPERMVRLHSTLLKTIIVDYRNSAVFTIAESSERDGRITKHSTLLNTIIGIPGTMRNSRSLRRGW